jgi:phage terminase large subunit-like protein
MDIRPQHGPQTAILSTDADIAIYGGAAGGGKTYAALMEAVRHCQVPGFGCVIFRRTYPRITNEGGLWDESKNLYPQLGGKAVDGKLKWTFPGGGTIMFRHLQRDETVEEWKGAQIALIIFDEVTEFTERQFFYMLSRNRSTCGVRPYVRATTNPDSESWVAKLIEWWVDDDGYPIPERSGVVRYMVRLDEKIHWADTRQEATELAIKHGVGAREAENIAKSFTFIPAKLEDNPALTSRDPGYMANLMALPRVDRLRLLGGNWKVKPEEGLMFPRNKWQRVATAPADITWCRGWDKAGTDGPDTAAEGKGARSAGVLVGYQRSTLRWYIGHVRAGRWADWERETEIRTAADWDNKRFGGCYTVVEQEPGSGGKFSARFTASMLSGHHIHLENVSGEKAARWRPMASQQQAGNFTIVDDGTWDVDEFIAELDALSGDKKQDQSRLKDCADAASLGFNFLAESNFTVLPNELLCSGDPENREEERQRIPDSELHELPSVLQGILKDIRSHGENQY